VDVIAVAILRRRLREGKTYDDFRRAWYHQTGFGASNRMFTLLNVAEPREVIVIALTEATLENAGRLLEIDSDERTASPLDDVIEPALERSFGILVAEDDFSAAGPIEYRAASVGGKETDLDEVRLALAEGARLLTKHLEARRSNGAAADRLPSR
jgi:hypothetical protein